MTAALLVSVIVLGLIVLLLLVSQIALLQQVGIINERLRVVARPFVSSDRGLEAGAEAPDFSLLNAISLEPMTFSPQDAGPTLLLFLSPTCGLCRKLITQLPHQTPDFQVLIVGQTTKSAAAEWALRENLPNVLIDESGEVADSYGVLGTTPCATAVVGGLSGGSGIVNHWDEALSLMKHAIGEHWSKNGDEIPAEAQRISDREVQA